jgi:hypothetical protein
MAACLCGGQWWKAGRRVQSCGMYLWSMRSIIPNFFLVQVHIIGPSPNSVILCWRESLCTHFEHALVAVSWMATNRSLVGIISCIAAYHVDFMVSETTKACKFFHTRSQLVPGNFRMIRMSLGVRYRTHSPTQASGRRPTPQTARPLGSARL